MNLRKQKKSEILSLKREKQRRQKLVSHCQNPLLKIETSEHLSAVISQLKAMYEAKDDVILAHLDQLEEISCHCVYPSPAHLPYKLMSEQATYEVLLDLCEMHPSTDLEHKISDYAFGILENIL